MEAGGKQQKETEVESGKKFIFGAAPNFSEQRLNLEIPILYFFLVSNKFLESNWNLVRKCVFLLSCLQYIRLQEWPFRSRGKTNGRAFPLGATWDSPGRRGARAACCRTGSHCHPALCLIGLSPHPCGEQQNLQWKSCHRHCPWPHQMQLVS